LAHGGCAASARVGTTWGSKPAEIIGNHAELPVPDREAKDRGVRPAGRRQTRKPAWVWPLPIGMRRDHAAIPGGEADRATVQPKDYNIAMDVLWM